MSTAGPPPSPPRRVRVTGPPAGRRPPRTSVSVELDEQTQLGDLYLRSLMRSQLRLAGTLTVVLALTFGLLPLAFLVVPALQHGRLGDVPLAWLLLGLVAYPALLLLALSYVRRAERNERVFSALVDPLAAAAADDADDAAEAPAGDARGRDDER